MRDPLKHPFNLATQNNHDYVLNIIYLMLIILNLYAKYKCIYTQKQ